MQTRDSLLGFLNKYIQEYDSYNLKNLKFYIIRSLKTLFSDIQSWYQSDPNRNYYGCKPKSYSECVGSGDPHIYTFDNAKIDVYGRAQYVYMQHVGSDEIPALVQKSYPVFSKN